MQNYYTPQAVGASFRELVPTASNRSDDVVKLSAAVASQQVVNKVN